MAPNIEPIVHGLMKNTTSTKLVNNLDQDLLNPYKDNINTPSNQFDSDSFIADLNKRLTNDNDDKDKIHTNILEEKSDKHDEMNVMNKIDDIKEIITNKTISQLNNFKHKDNKNTGKILSSRKEKKKLDTNIPILLQTNMNVLNKIDPYENFKLLKFKESNGNVLSSVK